MKIRLVDLSRSDGWIIERRWMDWFFYILSVNRKYWACGNFLNVQFFKPQLSKSVLATVLRPKPVLAVALGP